LISFQAVNFVSNSILAFHQTKSTYGLKTCQYTSGIIKYNLELKSESKLLFLSISSTLKEYLFSHTLKVLLDLVIFVLIFS
jgi:hypothetical protein